MEGDPLHPVAAAGTVTAEAPVETQAVTRTADLPDGLAPQGPSVELPPRVTRALQGVSIVGAVLVVVGLLVSTDRTWAAMLLASQYALGIGLAGIVFVALGYVTGAGWAVAIRRVPEAMAGSLPVGALAVVVALVGLPWLYHWTHVDLSADPILEAKSWWLNTGGFVVRAVLYLAVWLGLTRAIRRNSERQDATHGVEETRRNVLLSAVFLIAFGFTFSAASFDWIMSLEPHWYSTVFGIYTFSGMFTCGLAVFILLLAALKRMGKLAVLRESHLHDLGRLLFGFATFWGYIWFCQYMLIWYGAIPEETAYYLLREQGAWHVLSVMNPIVNWLIPFLILLPRPAKRNLGLLVKVCVLILLGHWLDLFVMINPTVMADGPVLGLWEIAPLMVALPWVVLATFKALGGRNLVPEGDPYLVESLHHHT